MVQWERIGAIVAASAFHLTYVIFTYVLIIVLTAMTTEPPQWMGWTAAAMAILLVVMMFVALVMNVIGRHPSSTTQVDP